jgi:hypothetical protein
MGKEKKRINLRNEKPEIDHIFPKSEYELGPEFKETDLGYSEGAIRQYRGPNNQHILEYEDHYKGHRDISDPYQDPIGHLINDAPETIITGGFSILGFIGLNSLYARWKSRRKMKTEDVLWIIAIAVIIILILLLIYWGLKMYRESRRRTVYG